METLSSQKEQKEAPPFEEIVLSIQVLCLATSAYTAYNPSYEGKTKIVFCTCKVNKRTHNSTSRCPAGDADEVVPVGEGVLHGERSSAVPLAEAFACGTGADHVARDLVLVLPKRHSDTRVQGIQGGVEGRVGGGGLTDCVRHDGHLDLL